MRWRRNFELQVYTFYEWSERGGNKVDKQPISQIIL